jgi:hypothetical protein
VFGISFIGKRGNDEIRIFGLNAPNHEFFSFQAAVEALLIEFRFPRPETQPSVSMISDPLPWAFLEQLSQVPEESVFRAQSREVGPAPFGFLGGRLGGWRRMFAGLVCRSQVIAKFRCHGKSSPGDHHRYSTTALLVGQRQMIPAPLA